MDRSKFFLLAFITLIVISSIGLSIYFHRTTVQIDENLTNEYHEGFRHANKLQRDILKFGLMAKQYAIDTSEDNYESLFEAYELLYLRYDVVSGLGKNITAQNKELIESIPTLLEAIAEIVEDNPGRIHSNPAVLDPMIVDLEHIGSRLAVKFDDVVWHHLGSTGKVLRRQGLTLYVFLVVLCLAIIGLSILYIRQKQSAENMNRLRNMLSDVINSMPSVLVGVDKELRITFLNSTARERAGMSSEDIEGKVIDDAYPQLANDREQIQQSISTKTVLRDTNRQDKKENSTSYYDLTVFPIAAKDLEGAVIRLDDVTEKHNMQEQLNHRNKMDAIGQLAGGVAHDFNNMLSGIMGASELLGKQLPNEPQIRMLHAMIIESAERAAGLTQKLLAFARKQHPASTAIDMHTTIHDSIALLEKTIDKRISITSVTNASKYMVVGDPSQLQSVLLNLGINSSHAMPDGGQLTITTSTVSLDEQFCGSSSFDIEAGDYLKIEFRDTGCGIPPEDLAHIFEPFYTTKSQGKGTGLGLAAVFGTVQQHQGAISVESEPGKGTVFYILLPVTRKLERRGRDIAQPITGSGKILVIDDEEVMRITAKAILKDLGYEVLLAEDGQQGLEIFEKERESISLVLLDMIMPKMNGKDCFLRMVEMDPDVRVILASGYSREEDVAQMRQVGLSGFISKPYRTVELSRIISRTLNPEQSPR